ncbi:hypothetical protein [Photobacterium lutimaris]|uniref:Uncharacterized protein n=1 Tax=Photobacterium lutimaris TaxID=388278 RepID=A0A2T3ITM4_9GAMM|nr:hypothetical protein [Photobacterium lutimaris]PSU31715.1 hypothetical protein C9I99_21245 [Photobacterium lutimaris]TDR72646.1 hypothetical protein DFP78_113122 [Photobacterium lutimaris]
MEREITIQGTQVIYHAFKHDPSERKVDFTRHLELITSTICDLVLTGKPRFIGIEGQSGSGKSGLAKVLKDDGVNVIVIDVCALRDKTSQPTDISDYFGDGKVTIVIDELGFADCNCYPLINKHLDQGGTVVALVQSKMDVDLEPEFKWLSMDRNGIRAL